MEKSDVLVSMHGIDKIFFGAYANRNVDFDLRAGEVHALLGENGAGKTTLMNVLTGIYAPDGGTISVKGKACSFFSPKDAIASGIGMVHQHFMLVPVLTVWENMILGLGDLPFVLNKNETIARIEALSEKYGLEVDPGAYVWQLSIGEQQRVEILKMLYRGTDVLILDEPTSVLTPQEVEEFFKTLRSMTAAGHGVVLISHKMEEILSIADRLTVLRKGEKIGTVSAQGATRETIAEMMVGRALQNIAREKRGQADDTRQMTCVAVFAKNDRGLPALKDISFELRKGEILGVAGVAGNGQGELCEALCGLRRIDSGSITVGGASLANRPPREFIDNGVSYVPVDRKGVGLVANMNLRENVALKRYWRPPAAKMRWLIDWEYIAGLTGGLVAEYDVVARSLDMPVRTLSGGNLQKLMLARELSSHPKVVLAMNPVWGLDVGATEFVHKALLEECENGAGVLLISEDLDELFEFSDRLIVMCRGEITGRVDDLSATTKEAVGLMMAGGAQGGGV